MNQINPTSNDSRFDESQNSTTLPANVNPVVPPVQPVSVSPERLSAVYPETGSSGESIIGLPAPEPKSRYSHRLQKTKKYIYLGLLLVMAITVFTRNNYRNISTINSEALADPKQTTTSAQRFIYAHKGIDYEITPIFNYELAGMVVGRLDYEKMPDADVYADDTLFPTDVCMIWGENLSSGIYKSRSTSFSQGGRWCTWRWKEGKGVINEAVANNHLLFVDDNVKKEMKGIRAGDQIKISGKLVNVETVTKNAPPEKVVTRHSSTVRTDTGDNSCEDILVDNVLILQKNRNISQTLFNGSLTGIGALLISTMVYKVLVRRKNRMNLIKTQPSI